MCIGYTTYIDDSEEKAINNARRYFEENMKMFAPLGFVRGLSKAQMAALGRGDNDAKAAELPSLEEAVTASSWLCGRSESVIEKLEEVQDRYPGLEQINAGSVIGTPQNVIFEQLERFGKEVMPHFKKSTV